jgi:hypothetical protein
MCSGAFFAGVISLLMSMLFRQHKRLMELEKRSLAEDHEQSHGVVKQ